MYTHTHTRMSKRRLENESNTKIAQRELVTHFRIRYKCFLWVTLVEQCKHKAQFSGSLLWVGGLVGYWADWAAVVSLVATLIVIACSMHNCSRLELTKNETRNKSIIRGDNLNHCAVNAMSTGRVVVWRCGGSWGRL